MIKVTTDNNELVKTTFDNGHDVEMTKRGLMNVHIKQEYNGQTLEYDTSFSVNRDTPKNTFEGD